MKLRVILQGLVVCTVVWTMVFAVQGYFRPLLLTAEKVEEFIEESDLADWSARENEPGGAEAEGRKKRIHEIAELLSKLDFEVRYILTLSLKLLVLPFDRSFSASMPVIPSLSQSRQA